MIARIVALVRRVPAAGRACFVIAFVNAAIWSVVVPPFQVPDEIAHFGYAQYLAETGKPPPQRPVQQYSPQEYAALSGLGFYSVIGRPTVRGVVTAAEDRQLRTLLAASSDPRGPGGSTPSTNQPPLYYALEAVPYWLSPSHDILARLQLMRLLSALLAAGTVLCVFYFLRELMPGTPWAWTVGALAVAFQPTFAFIAAGVQGDNLLFLASAATFLALLRAYRHGLTVRRGVFIGAATTAGLLGKLTFIAFTPGIALALGLLTWRALPQGKLQALRRLGVALGIVIVAVGLYALLNTTIWHRGSPAAGGLASVGQQSGAGGQPITLRESLDYIWQLYLPKLPFMNHAYFAKDPIWDLWLNGSIGHFGWLDYTFPGWVYSDGLQLFYVLLALAIAGLLRLGWGRPAWRVIRSLVPIFLCFALMALGLLGAIGWQGIRYRLTSGYQFEQARYLFPLLVFYGLFVALAARGAPRRIAPAVGAAIVLLAMAHGLFAETLTISRYYG